MKFSQEPVSDPNQVVSPICLVGKNGTGKSNTLELICEIFYYLDSLLLDYPSETVLSKKRFGFEIEYRFELMAEDVFDPWDDANFIWDESSRHVKIVKSPNQNDPIYLLVDKNGRETQVKRKNDTKREVREKIVKLLPNKVIGYSSGLNELISTPFLKMQFHYFNEYQKRLEEDVLDDFGEGKLLYLNYESNAAILVANLLLGNSTKLEILNDTLEIIDLESFRIAIELGNYIAINSDAGSDKEKYDVTDYFKREINRLKQIATAHEEIVMDDRETGESKTLLLLDFKVDLATKSAFEHFFGDSYSLYSFFQRMHLLNLYKISAKKRDSVRNASSGINVSNLLPKSAFDELLFRIDRVRLVKSDSRSIINYKSISDGEHQFIHIIGAIMIMNQPKTLMVLDEPETHFNPRWRSKLISTINKVEKAEIEISKASSLQRVNNAVEIILTTHSPFILSDSHRTKVWKFRKIKGDLIYDIIELKTYGAAFSVLLEEAFDKEETISEMSLKFLEMIKMDIQSPKDIEDAKKQIKLLGDSTEKVFLLEYLNEKQKEFD